MRFVLKIWNDHINGKMMVDVLRFVPLVGSKFLVFLLNCAVCIWATINTPSILYISFREAFCPILLLKSTSPLPVPCWWLLMYATILTMHIDTLLWSSTSKLCPYRKQTLLCSGPPDINQTAIVSIPYLPCFVIWLIMNESVFLHIILNCSTFRNKQQQPSKQGWIWWSCWYSLLLDIKLKYGRYLGLRSLSGEKVPFLAF